MSRNKFVVVSLQEWDNSCVKVEDKDKRLNITYNGLVPILKITGSASEPFLLSSSEGLKKSMKYDMASESFSKTDWAGDWQFSFRLTDNLSSILPPTSGDDTRSEADKLRYKLIDIHEYMKKLIVEATDDKVLDPISYKKVYTTTKLGKKKPSGIDSSGYAYLTAKVGYVADENCETMKDRDREVPVHSARRPKPKMYDLSRAEGDELLTNPEVEAAVPMRANPRLTYSVNNSPQGWNLGRNVLEVYFKKDESLASVKARGLDEMRKLVDSNRQLIDSIPE